LPRPYGLAMTAYVINPLNTPPRMVYISHNNAGVGQEPRAPDIYAREEQGEDMAYIPTVHIAIAAHRLAEQRKEEESMTYSKDDMDGWEFKIMRSATGAFRKPEVIQQLCREESRAGWEMLEKFDNSRIRFKRRIDRRASDQSLGFDPYRTNYGGAGIAAAAVAIAAMAALIGIGILTFSVGKGKSEGADFLFPIIPILIILIAVFVIWTKRRSRE
jgi:hypothetical protein